MERGSDLGNIEVADVMERLCEKMIFRPFRCAGFIATDSESLFDAG